MKNIKQTIMKNTTPWQTLINTNNNSKVLLSDNNLVAIKQTVGFTKNTLSVATKKTTLPKRYSFDDNGGGYLGL